MSLAKPELTDEEFAHGTKNAYVEEVKRSDTAGLYHVHGVYKAMAYDHMNLASRVGDYNGEWVGKRMAERLAKEKFGEGEDVSCTTVVLHDGDNIQERMEYENTYYEVAIISDEE